MAKRSTTRKQKMSNLATATKNKLRKPKKLTKAEKLAFTPIEEFARIKADSVGLKKMADVLRSLQLGFTRRAATFAKKGIFSQAVYGMKNFTPPQIGSVAKFMKNKKLNDFEKRNIMLSEISKYQNFFMNKTSTLEGNAEVQRNQDIMVFGKDENGEPRYTMNALERETYWKVYNEYMNMYPTRERESNDVQRVIADALFIRGDNSTIDNITGDGFMERLLQIELLMKGKEFEDEQKRNAKFSPFTVLTVGRDDYED